MPAAALVWSRDDRALTPGPAGCSNEAPTDGRRREAKGQEHAHVLCTGSPVGGEGARVAPEGPGSVTPGRTAEWTGHEFNTHGAHGITAVNTRTGKSREPGSGQLCREEHPLFYQYRPGVGSQFPNSLKCILTVQAAGVPTKEHPS